MGDNEYRSKLKSLSLNTGANKGRSKTTQIAHDDEPRVAGATTEHWDGRVDSTVFAEPAKTTPQIGL
jgi:hypothetical protein